jgi:hypothetical protein
MYPTGQAHAPYCHLWPVRLYHIIPHYLINGTIVEKKKLLNIKCVLISSTAFCLEHFSFQEKISQISQTCTGIQVKYPLIFSDVNKALISRHIFRKHSNIKFHENPSGGSPAIPCARTDRHDKDNSHFSQFCGTA